MLIRELLFLGSERFPQREAIVDGELRLTYSDFYARVLKLAGWLQDKGITRGQRVAIGMRNSADNATLIMACHVLGAVTVPFNIRLKPPTIHHILTDSGSSMIVLDDTVDLKQTQQHCNDINDLVWVDATTEGSRGQSIPFSAYMDADLLNPVPDLDESDLSTIIYTSGTTGLPKGVAISNAATYSRLVTYIMSVGPQFDSGTRTLGAAPLYHTVGLHWVFLQTMFVNGTYFPVPKVSKETVDFIQKEQITFMIGSPTLFKMMVTCAQGQTIPSMKYITYGSAAAEPELLEAMYETFPNASISEFYGTTELSIPFITPSMKRFTPGTLRIASDFRVRIIRPGGAVDEVVEPGELGELIVHMDCPGIFETYWGPEGETKKASKTLDDWFLTGDGCRFDTNGNYYYDGRLDDMFVSGGENIQPVEVEKILSGIPQVSDCAVMGLPDPLWGSVVAAFIVRNDESLDEDAIEKVLLASELEDFKRPRKIYFVDEIPRNPSGKIVRGRIREELLPTVGVPAAKSSA